MEEHLILQIGPQAETLHPKLLLVGSWGRARPRKGQRMRAARARGSGVVRCQNPRTQTGRQHRITTGHMIPHTPPVGAMRFLACPSSCLYTLPRSVMGFHYTQTDPERKLPVFSDDGYVFVVVGN